MTLSLRFINAEVLHPGGLSAAPLSIADGVIAPDGGRAVDLSGYTILPGIVDAHGDGFERHLAPRRGAMKDIGEGLIAAEAELAANGVTTAVLAQFYSWEGGMRGPDFAQRVMEGLGRICGEVVTDLRAQLRFELSMVDDYDTVAAFIAAHEIGYVVFNDHLPHEALAAGKRPPRLTGQALRIGRNPEKHLAAMQALHAGMHRVPAALAHLTADLARAGVRMGSHDDRTEAGRAEWQRLGATIAEFPETIEAAEAARAGGDSIVMGAPNVVRGGSHNGNASAPDMAAMGLIDALASDYHYPSLRRAAFLLADAGIHDLAGAWHLVSKGPAQVLGLADRGDLAPGQRADLVVIDSRTRRVAATLAGGRISHAAGDVAERFFG
ncbi:alpha-D-ribose 1-methylphosphonate 5-triphosphate diphosphatase [Roseovarius nanhaiticus]|uniref:Alpha-D-ribose 1-methylphosphonate 5-triphosphate diphosphatase n=1 Tax=Roseovarius nanhaiticus TaxID=573024 RepID=A0A1N7H2X5_9RHOB|nr:alpha-D-ribose 1-methylphosphonate 5-triphosphate diphosphatase [Roseovarius nanhaiticus]SEL15192.1 alpha-D-ribose 1-methylphosphonate 5-triphosphate diphosphatase [Roseovarius nanhaiticus]SIS19110.1 alpha-D-ribose 1-methylphosphonate 5-triphosphate diphosphatase [Roseovarius nanhaiticus]